MPNKRPIPKVDPKHYAEQGYIVVKPSNEGDAITLSLHHCTAFLNEEEALVMMLSTLHACTSVWSSDFTRKFLTYLERI